MAVTGRVVRFDDTRGYGFVAPDSGGEDVFLHANDLAVDKHLIAPGVLVEFEIGRGDKGLKAMSVRLAEPAHAAKVKVEEKRPDLLTRDEFLRETTEALIAAAPSVTGEQIVAIRNRFAVVARSHGWIDN
ncbi:cold-shock protein [Antrihabitans stalactiti]|uniref:Cold shock domain-containing protein n=1 Tax=Antrihabitans stalactiti TaxID=2584121 RepID=A0A848KJW8_9NOCA|nr:cold shock domain-containing protein [Antrihabitans stalactiti]NMN96530.1 cold shock domain-containing protein [Antrihabitans stalactiti]